MPEPLAKWNPSRDCWESTDQIGLLSEHLDVYSETFPTSGMTRNGLAFERQMPELRTPGSGCSSLPTPRASRGASGTETMYALGGERSDANRPQGEVLLKTPTSQLAVNGGSQHPDKRKEGGHGPTLADEIEHLIPTVATATSAIPPHGGPKTPLLPTPAASVANDGEGTETWLARRERVKLTAQNGNGMGMPLTIAALLIGETTSPLSDAGSES